MSACTLRPLRAGLFTAALLFTFTVCPGLAHAQRRQPLVFSAEGRTVHGDWSARVSMLHDQWSPGQALTITVALRLAETHLASLAAAGIRADKLCVLVTAERTFDADGWLRLASDERMSTLLTPAGLAIEGGVQGAVTRRYGYAFGTPLDVFQSISMTTLAPGDTPGTRLARFHLSATLPAQLPPGLYRLRLDFGVMAGTRTFNINGFAFASRPFSNEDGTSTYAYSPLIPANGVHVSGRVVDSSQIQPRLPWLLLAGDNSSGYRGVGPDEDATRFATSDRNLISDDVILPMFDDSGNRVSYSLEPQFPTDTIDARQNLPWDWTSGELAVRIAGPDGSIVNLGPARFVAKSGNGPTTKNSAFTAWRPQAYGRYTVTATGWIADLNGRRYQGGGTYRFWIAKRMTLATATFQGMAYPVGTTYGRDIQFNPAVPAQVQVTATLYVDSDPANTRTLSYTGTATSAGLFGAAQGMKPFALSAAGEYHAQVIATYTDAEGHLWVSTMRHAGIVYPADSPVVARGKKLLVAGKYVDRGDTKDEGYIGPDGTQHLNHVTFPWNAGDVLLIASDGQGANKIEPVLTYQMQGDTAPWDTSLNGVGTTNLRIKTSNGYSPHLYPEYITDFEYFYAAAPRPGFMGRFLVGENNLRAPYWPVSPNSFGGQIGASVNGDAPGDIYRLIGGVVLRRARQAPMYAGYIASAFLLPKGSNNNRVVAPGAEDLYGPTGTTGRFFLVGLRPGTALELGGTFRPAVQIDPLLPAAIRFDLTYPDGRRQVAEGTADRFGSFAGATAWPLDAPGVYTYQLRATWNGFSGRMPGLPDGGGEFYVYSKTRPAGAAGLRLDGATQRTFSAASGVIITGTSTATRVHYALITPGAVIEQGRLAVRDGRFQYVFDPAAVHAKVPLYDIVNRATGRPQIGRVIHLTFFSEERAGGTTYFDVARVILRGTSLLSPRIAIPPALAAAAGAPESPTDAVAPAPARARIDATDLDAVRAWEGPVDRLLRENQLRIVARERDVWLSDRVHERLQQYDGALPVFGGEVVRQFDRGVIVSMFGTVSLDIDVDPAPRTRAAEAQAVIARLAGGPASTPTLGVMPVERGYVLAWRAMVTEHGTSWWWAIDAQTARALGASRAGSDDLDVLAAAVRARVGDTPPVQQVFARTWRYLLPEGADSETARRVTMQSAEDLFGADAAVTRAIAAAWPTR